MDIQCTDPGAPPRLWRAQRRWHRCSSKTCAVFGRTRLPPALIFEKPILRAHWRWTTLRIGLLSNTHFSTKPSLEGPIRRDVLGNELGAGLLGALKARSPEGGHLGHLHRRSRLGLGRSSALHRSEFRAQGSDISAAGANFCQEADLGRPGTPTSASSCQIQANGAGCRPNPRPERRSRSRLPEGAALRTSNRSPATSMADLHEKRPKARLPRLRCRPRAPDF